MDRTSRVIEYLKRYHHLCYIKAANTNSKPHEEKLRAEMKEIDSLIKELKEHGCRRTVDGN